MKALTAEQHQKLLQHLVDFARQTNEVETHPSGIEYTSLMISFLLHDLNATETLLRLAKSFGNDWFPVTIGYVVDRSIFEVMINAHYIARDPTQRSRQYIEYGHVIKKNTLETFQKHRNTTDALWHEFIGLVLEHELEVLAPKIDEEYEKVKTRFQRTTRKGKTITFPNWAGKSIREMACEVDHEIEYDLFYSDLSSFTHANVRLADQFLRFTPSGLSWTQHADDFHVGNVFRYAATFFTCFLILYGREFNVWTEQDVGKSWEIIGAA